MRIDKIVEKVDSLYAENRGQEAQKLLEDAIRQAMEEGDDNSLLILLNEIIGYMRETSQVEQSYRYAGAALSLMKRMGIEGSTPYATTLLNIANAYRAGGRLVDSMEYYQEVLRLYEKQVDKNDMLFASLHNNISLLYQEMGEYEQAIDSLKKALDIVKANPDTYFEEAVTYANLASTCLMLNEDERAAEYFRLSIQIFEEHEIMDAHYCAALSAMGTYHYKKKEYTKAAECLEKALAGMKASLGENEYYRRLSASLEECRRAAARAERGPGIPGLKLCRQYYETFGKPMIQEQFAEYENRIAVGLCGEGSDCFGYDDEISEDHDWGPGFCMWVSDDVYAQIGEKLQEAYEKLPKEFLGYQRQESRQGKGRMGVITITAFFQRLFGRENVPETLTPQNLDLICFQNIPDEALAASVNGEVFLDTEGTFSAIREGLKKGFPQRLYYLKIAESCARFSQAAQYNFFRMSGREDSMAAGLSLIEGLRHAMKLIYYISGEYPPHDKWLYRGIAEKKEYQKAATLLLMLLEYAPADSKEILIGELASQLVQKLYAQDIISDSESYLEAHTEELLLKAAWADKSNEELSEAIAELEFEAFDKVQNAGGRASCQNNWHTFQIMRKSQYLTWNRKMLLQYLYDFKTEYAKGHNLIEEKYGRMMESTAPLEYAEIAGNFPVLSEEKKQIIEAIVKIQVGFMEEFAARYPHLAENARTIHTEEDSLYDTSYETYLRGEISTYSDKMLELYGRFVTEVCNEGGNLAERTMQNSVELYGYKSLEEAEKAIP